MSIDRQEVRIAENSIGGAGGGAEGKDDPSLSPRSKPPFDIVVLDIMMSPITGKDILRAMRRNIELSAIPVIMLSADQDANTIQECCGLGASDFCVKPLDVRNLDIRLQEALRRSRYDNWLLSRSLQMPPSAAAKAYPPGPRAAPSIPRYSRQVKPATPTVATASPIHSAPQSPPGGAIDMPSALDMPAIPSAAPDIAPSQGEPLPMPSLQPLAMPSAAEPLSMPSVSQAYASPTAGARTISFPALNG